MKQPRMLHRQKNWLLILGLCLFLHPCLGLSQETSSVGISLVNKRVLWLGDSITQAGDYVTLVQFYLDKQNPGGKFDMVSAGLASETVSGLSEKAHPFPRPCVLERLQRALDKVKPDVVIACYGMNDGIYHPQNALRMDAFQKGMLQLISTCKAAGAQVILLTPPPFDKVAVKNLQPKNAPDFSYRAPFEDYDSVLGDYARWEQTLSSNGVLVIDLHTPINDYLKKRRESEPGFSFTGDGIHPNGSGHLLMAEIILKGLGISWTFNGDLDAEFSQTQGDPLYSLVKAQRENRSKGWLDYIGYIRDKKVAADSIDKTEQVHVDLQAKIDQVRNGPKS